MSKNAQNIMAQIGVAHLTWKRYCQRRVQPYGITLKQYYVLNQLTKIEILTPSDIARMLYCDRPTATVIISNMLKHGWIHREQDASCKRYTNISITANGKELLELIKTQPSTNSFDPSSIFCDDEIEILMKLLRKLNKHLAPLKDIN